MASSRRRFLQLSEATTLGGFRLSNAGTAPVSPGATTGDFILEPAKKVPVARQVDVVVAGAGIAGLFVALGSARAEIAPKAFVDDVR